MIPKNLHMIWVGDDSKRPIEWMDTWKKINPDFNFRIWGNNDLRKIRWINHRYMDYLMRRKKYSGVSDLMRLEILYRLGGIYVDADSICENPFDDDLLSHKFFAIWETADATLIANGMMGAEPRHPVLKQCIDKSWWRYLCHKQFAIRKKRWKEKPAWRVTGPVLLTRQIHKYGLSKVHMLPSYTYMREHHSGARSDGLGIIYGKHLWGDVNNLWA